jgi:hypothetical protein
MNSAKRLIFKCKSICELDYSLSVYYLIKKPILRSRDLWTVKWIRTTLTVTALMNHAAERANAVTAFIITGRMMNCPHVFLTKNRNVLITAQ